MTSINQYNDRKVLPPPLLGHGGCGIFDHHPTAAPDPVSSTARAFLRPADHDRRKVHGDAQLRLPLGLRPESSPSGSAVLAIDGAGIMFYSRCVQAGARWWRRTCRRRLH